MTETVESKVAFPAGLLIELWLIDRPTPYSRNARKISDKAVDKVAASIKEFGFRQPLVVDDAGVIIAGHARLLAAKKLGLATVPVHVAANLSPAQVKAYRLADNRTSEETSWNFELLADELKDLTALSVDLDLTGFDMDELEDIQAPAPEQPRDNRGRWIVKPGSPERKTSPTFTEPATYPEFEATLDRRDVEAWANGFGSANPAARDQFQAEIIDVAFHHLALHYPGELLDGCRLQILVKPLLPPQEL
jgi:hypothetical protein